MRPEEPERSRKQLLFSEEGHEQCAEVLCSSFLATHGGLGSCPAMLTQQDGSKSISLEILDLPSELRVDGPFLLQGPSKNFPLRHGIMSSYSCRAKGQTPHRPPKKGPNSMQRQRKLRRPPLLGTWRPVKASASWLLQLQTSWPREHVGPVGNPT